MPSGLQIQVGFSPSAPPLFLEHAAVVGAFPNLIRRIDRVDAIGGIVFPKNPFFGGRQTNQFFLFHVLTKAIFIPRNSGRFFRAFELLLEKRAVKILVQGNLDLALSAFGGEFDPWSLDQGHGAGLRGFSHHVHCGDGQGIERVDVGHFHGSAKEVGIAHEVAGGLKAPM